MAKSIVENHQVHLLLWVLLVVSLHFLVDSLSDTLDVWAGFIYKWSFLDKFSILIELIISLEVSE